MTNQTPSHSADPNKRQKLLQSSDKENNDLGRPNSPTVVYLHSSIPHLQQRGALWRKKLGARFVFAKDLSDCRITHVVVGEVLGAEAQAALLASLGGARSASTCFMRDTWLCEVALRGGSRPADEQRHVFPVMQCHQQQQPPPAPGSLSAPASAALGGNSSSSRVPRSVPSLPGSLPAPTAPKAGFHRWLGFWSPALDSVTSANELVLHARCDIARSAALGNEPLVAALVELKRYELAVIADRPGASDDVIAHEALGYAKAACAVRACAFPITDELSPQQLQRSLPFVGPFFARLLHSLAETGTCSQLEDYRANRAVRDSRGNVRHHTEGGAVKEQFCRLPNVGPTTAARWFREGYRSLAAVAAAAARRPPEEAPGLAKRDVRYILQHHADILEDVPPADVEEMRQAALECLQGQAARESSGWNLVLVGGGRRNKPSHDVDFLVFNNSEQGEQGPAGHAFDGAAERLAAALVAQGKLVPQQEGFLRVTAGRLEEHVRRAAEEALPTDARSPELVKRSVVDGYDRIFGVFITAAGKRRRVDFIFVPRPYEPFALLGWTGSSQYLRFLKTHAKERGCFFNSHFLMRPLLSGESEATTPGAIGAWAPVLPPGSVKAERQIVEALGVPYLEPHERCHP